MTHFWKKRDLKKTRVPICEQFTSVRQSGRQMDKRDVYQINCSFHFKNPPGAYCFTLFSTLATVENILCATSDIFREERTFGCTPVSQSAWPLLESSSLGANSSWKLSASPSSSQVHDWSSTWLWTLNLACLWTLNLACCRPRGPWWRGTSWTTCGSSSFMPNWPSSAWFLTRSESF